MKSHIHLLQIELYFHDYKFALLCFLTAFVVTLVMMPPIIYLVKRYSLCDIPDHRKEHSFPVPTMGGIAIVSGMLIALELWFPFSRQPFIVSFFLAIITLVSLGIMDDLKDLSAKYKLIIQIVVASMIAVSGLRITSLNGLFGMHELSISAQYTLTVLTIVLIINAFNLIDGIDGLAGGLGFMTLLILGVFLTLSKEPTMALIAFAFAGALLAFLYFNLHPAKIFMGDTGSLVLGFVIAVLSIKLIQVNTGSNSRLLQNVPIFVLGTVLIPVFDSLRVFTQRLWKGRSPFHPDRTHIHHLIINAGYSHAFALKLICTVHGLIMIEVYWLRELRQELLLVVIITIAFLVTIAFKNIGGLKRKGMLKNMYEEFKLRA